MNTLLQSILEINHLIVHESQASALLQKLCEILHSEAGYDCVWVALLNPDAGLEDFYSSGAEEVTAELEESSAQGPTAECFQAAVDTTGVVELGAEWPGKECSLCSIVEGELGVKSLQYAFDAPEGRAILTACCDRQKEICDDEREILATVAEDVGFALEHIEDEKKRAAAEKDRKKALQEAQTAKNRYKTLFDSLPNAIFIHDFKGNIIEVNQQACVHLNYSRSELLGMNVTDIDMLFEPEDTRGIKASLHNNDGCVLDGIHQTSDGEEIPVEIHSRMIRYEGQDVALTTFRDMTDEEMARQQKDRLLEAVRAAQEAIVVTSPTGRIVYANHAVQDLFGHPSDDLLGEPVWELMAENDPHRKVKEIVDELEKGSGWEGEIRVQKWEGKPFTCYATVTAVRDETGRISNYIATANDISDQKKTEEKLRKTVEELRQTERQVIDQERQRALSQMASGIAHDFNNSLSTIRGFTELLLEDGEKREDDEVLSKYLSVIDSAANNAADTVRRMRKFYRPAEEAELRPLDINNIVEEAISLTRPKWEQEAQAAGKSITVNKDLHTVPLVKGNEAELHEMLANIIFNAVDAIEQEGKIDIKTRRKGNNILLEVADNGMGMETYTRRHCVDPFYTTKGEDGTGLGLAVTAGIVRRHDGEMGIESDVGDGVTVRITLPANTDAEVSQTRETGEESYESGTALRVLVAEDDAAQRELIEDMLDVLGHTADIVDDGEEALKKFECGKYDIILTDRAMPCVGGDEVAQEIRCQNSDMPIVMVTGFGDMMEAAAEHPDDVDLVISKPLSLKKLSSAIEEAQESH